MTWSTLSSLGSDHLPITVSLYCHASPSPRKARPTRTSARLTGTGRDSKESQKGHSLKHLWGSAKLLLCWRKCLQRILSDVRWHHIPCGHVRDYYGSIPDVVRPFITERDQGHTNDPLDPLGGHLCWTGTSSGSFARKSKTSGGPSWYPPTAPPIPRATGLFCAS